MFQAPTDARAHGRLGQEADHDALLGRLLREALRVRHLEGDERGGAAVGHRDRRGRGASRRTARRRSTAAACTASKPASSSTSSDACAHSTWCGDREAGGEPARVGLERRARAPARTTPWRGSRSRARAARAPAPGSRTGSPCRPGRTATSGRTRRRSRSRARATSTGTAPRPCAPSSSNERAGARRAARVSMTRPVRPGHVRGHDEARVAAHLAGQVVERHDPDAWRRARRARSRAGRARRGAPRRS